MPLFLDTNCREPKRRAVVVCISNLNEESVVLHWIYIVADEMKNPTVRHDRLAVE